MSIVVDPDSGETVPEGATSPFPNPGDTAQDYDAQAQGEVLLQYRESTKLKATISALMAGWQAIEDCITQIAKLRDPAVATGNNLVITGELVGQSKILKNGTVESDAFFRLLIAARITRNNAIGTAPEFIAAVTAIVFPSTPFRYMNFGGLATGIEVGAEPTSDQIALLDAGPLPLDMAVDLSRVKYDPTEWFGFAEDTRTGSKGFGLESDASKGGKLAMLF
jgi:hypothetical protein